MRDYGRIVSKINQTPWLITPEGLDLVLTIVSERINNGRLEDTEIDARLASMGGKSKREDGLQVVNGVGVLPVGGPIFGKANMMTNFSGATSLESFQQDFRAMMADDSIHSIIMDMDTPGGTSDLVQEVGDEIFAARQSGEKPIYASVNTMCGSAGLWLATQANKIYSTPSGSIGSLGAYTAHQDQSVADAKDGVKFTYISAGQYKTEGNPHEPLSADAIAHRQEVVNSLMNDFVGAVARGRGANEDHVRANYGQGRMLMPKDALEAGMIDGIASFDSMLSSLTKAAPRPVQVVVPGYPDTVAAQMIDGVVTFGAVDDATRNMFLDMSIPDFVPSGPAITHVVPIIREEDDAMPQLSEQALTALGLSADATDEQISTAITSLSAKAAPMLELKNTIDAQKKFAEMFPEEAARMASLEASNREMNAKAFANSYRDVRFADITEAKDDQGNDIMKPTTKGLSGLALQKLEETHLKFADGSVNVQDFADSVNAILTGVVDYGQKGSALAPTEDITSVAGMNVFEIRTKFAELVVGEQNKAKADNVDLSDEDAMRIVAEKHPDIWNHYKNPQLLATATA